MENYNDECREINDYLLKLIPAIENAGNKFCGKEKEEGYELTILIADGIQWVIGMIKRYNVIELSEKQIIELNNKLIQVVEAMEIGDYILVGDLLTYEIKPEVELIKEKIEGTLIIC